MGDAAAGDGSVATSEEMFLAVERWSRARKIRIGDYPDPARLWEVTMTRPGTVGITKRDGAGRIDPTVGTKDNALQVAPEVAVAWALAVEAGLPAVDVGPCQACVARSLPGRKLATHVWMRDIDTPLKIGPGRGWVPGVRPCPDCNGTGRELREVARLVLDAAPTKAARQRTGQEFIHDVPTAWTHNGVDPDPARPVTIRDHGDGSSTWVRAGDPKAIETLTALADHLQPHAFDTRKPDPAREAAGHALAHLVALWLDGDLRETRTSVETLTAVWERLTVPCDPCRGSGRRGLGHWATWPDRGRRVKCSDCDGHGRVSPTPYRVDAVAGPSPAA